jgi:hypothetical protein
MQCKDRLEGTIALGNEDREEDGLSTRRRRRKVIVIKQRRGESMDVALSQSLELNKLGMSFEKFMIPSPQNSVLSPKNRKITLRKVEPGTKLYDELRSPKSIYNKGK